MEGESDPKSTGILLKPLFAVSICFICEFLTGTILGQTAVMIPQLQAHNSPIQIDEENASWIASIAMIGAPFSSMLCGPLTDKFGRTAVLKTFFLLLAIGYGVIGVATRVEVILIGRFCLGIAFGFSFPALVYISETTPPKQRGLFLALGAVWASAGLLGVMFLGGIFNWDLTALIMCAFTAVSMILPFFIPETPAWLFKNQRLEEAVDSLKWLRGENCDVDKELEQLKAGYNIPAGKVSFFRYLRAPTVQKPFLILTCLAFLQNGAGFYTVIFYSVNLLSMFNADFDPWLVSMALAGTRLLTSLISSYSQKKIQRRTLGAFSGFSTAAVLAVLLTFALFFRNESGNSAIYSGTVALCFILYVLFCSFGLYPLPWTLVYELYPLKVRGFMCGVSYGINILASFFFGKLFFVFIKTLGLYGTIFMFLLFSAAFGLFSIYILPETHGKSFVEIEEGFQNKDKQKFDLIV